MIRIIRLYVANLVSALSPATRGFALRRGLYRWSGVSIGDGAQLCGGVRLDNIHVRIGADTWVGGESRIVGGERSCVVVGDRCDLGPQVLLVAGTHELGPRRRRAGTGRARPIVIGNGTWVGARATVLAGATVGEGCVIAAGALVTADVADDTIVGGVPARTIRSLAQG